MTLDFENNIKNIQVYFEQNQNILEAYQYNETFNLSELREESIVPNLISIFKDNTIQESYNDAYSFKMNHNNNKNLDEKTTKVTKLFPNNKELNNDHEFNYKWFSFEEIKEFLNNGKFSGISEKFKKNSRIEEAEYRLCNKKRKRATEYDNNGHINLINNKKEIEERVKRGRKTIKEDNKYKKGHDKYSEDNIIKKINQNYYFTLYYF